MAASAATWEACIGPATWLSEPLHRILSYPQPLPVQQAVIPTITRSLMSGVPNDVSLTAPTGSGKTLCYLIPLVRLLTDTKRGIDDNALRCLILVPTQALGQQVYRELQRLTRPSSIKVACLCADIAAETAASAGGAARAEAAEAGELVRRVVVPRFDRRDGPHTAVRGDADSAEDEEEEEAVEDEPGGDEEHGGTVSGSSGGVRGRLALSSRCPDTSMVRYFSNVDVIVATPQRLLHHLDHTRGLRLVDLRLLVIDEADQVLAGNFASQVQKVNTRYELEVEQQQRRQQRERQRMAAVLTGAASSASPLELTDTNRGDALRSGAGAVLHKVLCSATLSSRIARISQVKLRNCSYYVLDSNGTERTEEAALTSSLSAAATAAGSTGTKKGASSTVVRTQFALPPTLQEHVVFVEDTYRPAVLLKLVHALRQRIAAARERAGADRVEEDDDADGGSGGNDGERAKSEGDAAGYPAVEVRAGTGILVFCATAEEARVMSHFLAAAGVPSVLEFTTLSSEAERRRALLEQHTDVDGEGVSCIVASDALMRGIDIPNVGHVVMYHPPDAVSQYVHRAGRTARAMRPGHVHLLLSKTGPSGAQEDGEVALYKRLSESLSRTLPVSYERSFFRFAEAPSSRTAEKGVAAVAVAADAAPAAAAAAPVEGTAEWWVAQAGQFLVQSQHQLQRRWASVLESAAAAAAAAAKMKAAAKVSASPALGTSSNAVSSSSASAATASPSASAAACRKRHRTAASAKGAPATATAVPRR